MRTGNEKGDWRAKGDDWCMEAGAKTCRGEHSGNQIK
jgi:hypothetical protein